MANNDVIENPSSSVDCVDGAETQCAPRILNDAQLFFLRRSFDSLQKLWKDSQYSDRKKLASEWWALGTNTERRIKFLSNLHAALQKKYARSPAVDDDAFIPECHDLLLFEPVDTANHAQSSLLLLCDFVSSLNFDELAGLTVDDEFVARVGFKDEQLCFFAFVHPYAIADIACTAMFKLYLEAPRSWKKLRAIEGVLKLQHEVEAQKAELKAMLSKMRVCPECGDEGSIVCSRCHLVYYCSLDHEAEHAAVHREQCGSPSACVESKTTTTCTTPAL